MAKMIKDTRTGKFTGRAPDPDNDWKRPWRLVWERASDASDAETATARPAVYRINPKQTKLIRTCQHCQKEFDALERTPDNYKMAEQAKYCSATCAKRAEAKRRRERAHEARINCLQSAKAPMTANGGGDGGGEVSRQTLRGWVGKLTRGDVK